MFYIIELVSTTNRDLINYEYFYDYYIVAILHSTKNSTEEIREEDF